MTRRKPLHLQADGPDAGDLNRFIGTLFQTEVLLPDPVSGKMWDVTEAGVPSMSVVVSAGAAIVFGDDSPTIQGAYFIHADADETVPIAASDPTNARISLIVATVRDSNFDGGGDYDWILQEIAGLPSGSPVAPAVPDNSILIREITVPASAGSIVNANISAFPDEVSQWQWPAARALLQGSSPLIEIAETGAGNGEKYRIVAEQDDLVFEAFDDTAGVWESVFEIENGVQGNRELKTNAGVVVLRANASADNLRTVDILPLVDSSYDLGSSGLRLFDIHADNGTIQTSDETLKTKSRRKAESLGLDFIVRLVDAGGVFAGRWKNGGKRTHQFVGAQTVEKTLAEIGLDPGDIALWGKARKTEVAGLERDGSPIVIELDEVDPNGRQSIRYGELIPPALRAIAELAGELEAVKAELAALKK